MEQNGVLKVEKAKGRLQNLIAKTENGALLPGTLGIGHTRWATHGEPNDTNSHPHVSQNGKIAVVHNGIIENYLEIREFLQQKGVKFASQTDTEVVAQLMEYCMGLPEVETVSDALYMVLHRIEGAYALGILCSDDPDHVYAARKDAPLLIGFGEGENFIASDVTALVKYTRDVVYMDDGEVAVLGRDGVQVYNAMELPIEKEHHHIDWEISAAEKGGYEPFHAQGDHGGAGGAAPGDPAPHQGRRGRLRRIDARQQLLRLHQDHRLRVVVSRGYGRQIQSRKADADAGRGHSGL